MDNSLFPQMVRPVRHVAACLLMLTLAIVCLKADAHPGHSRQTAIRLRFAKGQSRISVLGSLGVSEQRPVYSFYARAGQRLKITLQDIKPRGHHPAHLVSMYHITFPSGTQYGMKGYDDFDGRLTETGLYHIYININQMASNSTQGRYRLTLRRGIYTNQTTLASAEIR